MEHELTIHGVVTTPNTISADDFTDRFIAWVEENGWSFGGGIGPYRADSEIDELESTEQPFEPEIYNLATEITDALERIAAAVGNDKLPQLTLAYAQVMNTGFLTAQEILQFMEANVPLFGLLARSMGKTKAEVIELAHNHQIMAADVRRAFIKAGEKGGQLSEE